MDWQEQLITLYLYICNQYRKNLWIYNQRMSNYVHLQMTDEEVITIYLFGIIDKKKEIKEIYDYTNRHLRSWFPHLPSYVAFVQRLNRLSGAFAPLLEHIQSEQNHRHVHTPWLVDSFPVALAKQGHRFKAKVAPELADHGYCSTKKLYFYGVKVHIVGKRQKGSLPSPDCIALAPASENDGKVFDQIRPTLYDSAVFGDKAYQRPDAEIIETKQSLSVLTPVKKQKGQKFLDVADQWFSTAVSKVRQPIEGLFAWIEKKTGIECASRVRSSDALLVHVFGRLAAAMFFWNNFR